MCALVRAKKALILKIENLAYNPWCLGCSWDCASLVLVATIATIF